MFNSFSHKRNDKDPSAAILPGSGNRYWTCFSCGAKGDIFKAVMHREGIRDFYEQVEFLSKKYGVELEYEGKEPKVKPLDKNAVHNYFYQDEKGKTVYKVQRKEYFEGSNRKKTFLSFTKTDSGWELGLNGSKRYLYRIPKVLEAVENKDIVFIVEGEKCADQINTLGLVGTTTPGGARSFKAHCDDYVQYLKGANLVIIPDNDESGRQYAEDIIKSLKGTAASIKKLELPNLLEKGDIVDWVQGGGTREKLLEFAVAVEKHVTVFEEDNCYCKRGKDGSIKLSNFIINPKYMVVAETQNLIAAELVTEDGIITEKLLSSEDFNDVIPFRKAVEGFEFSYFGKAEDLQHSKVLISKKNSIVKKGTAYSGFHKLKNKWYFVSEEGTLAENFQPSEEVVLLEDAGELRTNILKNEEITREELMTIAKALFSFNTLNITLQFSVIPAAYF